jgi:hypothetical protein
MDQNSDLELHETQLMKMAIHMHNTQVRIHFKALKSQDDDTTSKQNDICCAESDV